MYINIYRKIFSILKQNKIKALEINYKKIVNNEYKNLKNKYFIKSIKLLEIIIRSK